MAHLPIRPKGFFHLQSWFISVTTNSLSLSVHPSTFPTFLFLDGYLYSQIKPSLLYQPMLSSEFFMSMVCHQQIPIHLNLLPLPFHFSPVISLILLLLANHFSIFCFKETQWLLIFLPLYYTTFNLLPFMWGYGALISGSLLLIVLDLANGALFLSGPSSSLITSTFTRTI